MEHTDVAFHGVNLNAGVASAACSLRARDGHAFRCNRLQESIMLTEPPTYAVLIGSAAIDPRSLPLLLAAGRTRLGFPSPAEDFEDEEIDLNQVLIRNPAATFLYRAEGWSMLHAGICDGDILLIDRSVQPLDGDVVVAIWDGNQPTCKILRVVNNHLELHSRNPHCPNIVLSPGTEAEVFAVVGVVRQMRREHGRVRAR